ncbi:MAG: phenylalanine--tRNA ligase subunit beta [Sedimentisphaerales bacterium]|nr:phenylalanine--tRNA ligase subunit beta [Sedimentisphaerales bacterium]
MKISLEWLREYVDYTGSTQELAELFTHVGLPVEVIEPVGDDWMLDVEVTSNRPDCLGHIGLAREVATVTGAALRLPDVSFPETGRAVTEWTRVEDQAPDLCGRYTARIIDGVTVGSSPEWMRRRLETVGLRAISNVVDITNYVMMEVGQPLHSFDYARLAEGKIVVRRARAGEQMVTIDHSRMELQPEMLVIADAREPVAVAGIMGGLASEVNDTTKTILLESAHFDPLSIRGTSRALTLASDSSFRFERNVDDVATEWASRRATQLLAQLAGGKVAPGVIDVWPGKRPAAQAQMRLSRLAKLVGIVIPVDRVMRILDRLGFQPQVLDEDTVVCAVPSWRSKDVYREADLIEEVIRIHGYAHVPVDPKLEITVTVPDAVQRTRATVGAVLTGGGFFETVNVSFVEDKYLQLFAPKEFEPVRVAHSSRKQANALRHTLLASLMEAHKRNQDAGNNTVNLYELAATHAPTGEGLPLETYRLGIAGACDFRTLRGTLEMLVQRLDRRMKLDVRPAEVAWAATGTGAELYLNNSLIGEAGMAGPDVIKTFDMNHDIVLAELDFSALVGLQGGPVAITPIMRFPGITRDLSLVLDEAVRWADIEAAIKGLGVEDMRQLDFVDIYRGKGVPKDKKSLTLTMEFRHPERTLTHEEVDAGVEIILAAMKKTFAAELRA